MIRIPAVLLVAVAFAHASAVPALAQQPRSWAVRIADSQIGRHPDPLLMDSAEPRWDFPQGLVLDAMLALAGVSGDQRYTLYVRKYYDGMIGPDGRIRTYVPEEFNLASVYPGKALLALYVQTKDEKYRKALDTLRNQLRQQPRTKEGGFWQGKRYPHQMWLEGIGLSASFLAQYGAVFDEPAAIDDAVSQFILMERYARNEKTGLLAHGWDESREQKWADPATGRSPSSWGPAMAWYAMGLVDALDHVPQNHMRRGELLEILTRLATAVAQVQVRREGMWFNVLDQGRREGNYFEASTSATFAYALMKAGRRNLVDPRFAQVGRRGFDLMLGEFLEVTGKEVHVLQACQEAGLGTAAAGGAFRDGSFESYASAPVRSNDAKAIGGFILADLEVQLASAPPAPRP
jgi:unsaturated rhamnogalacturonyl hydrolase